MKLHFKLFAGLLLVLILTGCIGEDYDVGVPTAHLEMDSQKKRLVEANIHWNTESENVHETITDIQKFALSQDEIKVSSNQEATLEFKENKRNGGDIWSDPKITAVLLKDEEQIEITTSAYTDFKFPSEKGNYVLKVEFKSTAGSAQYVGNIVVQ